MLASRAPRLSLKQWRLLSPAYIGSQTPSHCVYLRARRSLYSTESDRLKEQKDTELQAQTEAKLAAALEWKRTQHLPESQRAPKPQNPKGPIKPGIDAFSVRTRKQMEELLTPYMRKDGVNCKNHVLGKKKKVKGKRGRKHVGAYQQVHPLSKYAYLVKNRESLDWNNPHEEFPDDIATAVGEERQWYRHLKKNAPAFDPNE